MNVNAAAAAAAAASVGNAPPAPLPPLVPPVVINPIHGVLQVCGVNALASRDVFIFTEGLDSMEAFALLSGDGNVTEMAKRMSSRLVNAGRVILVMMHIKRIQALMFWVKDLAKRGITPDPDEWDVDEMAKAMERKEACRLEF